jgi:hypothetical protein
MNSEAPVENKASLVEDDFPEAWYQLKINPKQVKDTSIIWGVFFCTILLLYCQKNKY